MGFSDNNAVSTPVKAGKFGLDDTYWGCTLHNVMNTLRNGVVLASPFMPSVYDLKYD
jgi:hypothetical protein